MSDLGLFHVRALEETSSTNDEVKRALEEGEPEGMVVRARRQTGGYGRQGRIWASPEGGLYCSFLLRPTVAPDALPTLSLVVGLAVRRAVVELVGEHDAEAVQIKWPNDVVVVRSRQEHASVAKLCGISVEVHAGGVCVGVGVNVLPPAERPLVGGKNEPAYLAELAPKLNRMASDDALDGVLDGLLKAFAVLYDIWQQQGFAALLDEYNAHASLTGRDVTIVDREGVPLASGTVLRVDFLGRLVLRTPQGETPITSGEAHIA
ncbi:biotin--[acetyl-CoA-carboxylase] ligase [Eggerthella sp. YY7918]|uniref:biotin--[acetyl-CoA-carboxylase] ligase n=1 Tax=Eggerthella sp. (strain YY7918) TaxID=502558 RepID=UPI00021710E6|nr:biotin--[acetyl-CoA-carboxylase] ligase [Eggerthella sp. YY7918]BAK43531.1 biotin-(acetyl-CoA carboxylase) ligase [Eggerthella sp. YY7918]